jgi:nucleotide-binding universal stress UspA family protein
VTAGYASGTALNGGIAKPQAFRAKDVGHVVLAVLDRPETVRGVLSGAARLLEFGGGGRVEALAVRTPPVSTLMVADQAITSTEEAQARASQNAWASEVKSIVDDWDAKAKPTGVETAWIELEGDAGQVVSEHGRRSDAVAVACVQQPGRSSDALHAAIFATSRPVLIVPPSSFGQFGRVVAIAWKDDGRSTKAVLAAMSILARAEVVHVLQAGMNRNVIEVPPIFQKHGISARMHSVSNHDGPVGARILELAHQLGADLLVMGEFAHGEWREALLGGVTRYMLDHADLPILMRH